MSAPGGSAGPFSESARRGAPRVISVHVRDKPGFYSPVNVAHPPSIAEPNNNDSCSKQAFTLKTPVAGSMSVIGIFRQLP
jgi:hypothetical protein